MRDYLGDIRVDAHEPSGKQKSHQEEERGNGYGELYGIAEELLYGSLIALAPVLRSLHIGTCSDTKKEQVQYESDLSCE